MLSFFFYRAADFRRKNGLLITNLSFVLTVSFSSVVFPVMSVPGGGGR
jgi:hypothetical protein